MNDRYSWEEKPKVNWLDRIMTILFVAVTVGWVVWGIMWGLAL